MMVEAGSTTWLRPLFVNGGGASVEVGVDVLDPPVWWVRARGEAVRPHEDWRLLLPLMQPGYGGDYETAREMVVARLKEAGLDVSLVDSFPFEAPVLGADLARTPYWQELATSWRPHVRSRYVVAALSAQFRRLFAGDSDGVPLPPGKAEQAQVFTEVWRSFGADGSYPTWSSGRVDAAVRWSMDAGVPGVRALWRAWFLILREVAPNILHWNLMDQLWISARHTGFTTEVIERPPGEVFGPLSTGQALLVLRFLPLEGELGARLRDQLIGVTLAHEVEGNRFSTRIPLADMLV